MKTVLRQLGRYKRDALLCIGFTALEVVMDILLPFITAIIIDRGLEKADLPTVYRYGRAHGWNGLFKPDFCRVGGATRGTRFLGAFCQSAGSDLQQYPDLFVFQHR